MKKMTERSIHRVQRRMHAFQRINDHFSPDEIMGINKTIKGYLGSKPTLKHIRFAVGALHHLQRVPHRDAVIWVTNVLTLDC